MRELVVLFPIFDTFLILLFVFMASANRANDEEISRATAAAQASETGRARAEELSSKLRQEQERILSNLRDVKSENDRLARVASILEEERQRYFARCEELAAGLDELRGQIALKDESTRTLSSRLEKASADLMDMRKRLETSAESNEALMKEVCAVFGDPDLRQALEELLNRNLQDSEARERVRELMKALMEPERALQHMLVSSELSSLYAPISVHLNDDDSISLQGRLKPRTNDEFELLHQFDEFIRGYKAENKGVRKFIFVVTYGNCTQRFMWLWEKTMNNLQQRGEDVLATTPVYRRGR